MHEESLFSLRNGVSGSSQNSYLKVLLALLTIARQHHEAHRVRKEGKLHFFPTELHPYIWSKVFACTVTQELLTPFLGDLQSVSASVNYIGIFPLRTHLLS